MTASVLIEDRQACQQAGMDAYLPKPVTIDHLDSTIRTTVGPGYPDRDPQRAAPTRT